MQPSASTGVASLPGSPQCLWITSMYPGVPGSDGACSAATQDAQNVHPSLTHPPLRRRWWLRRWWRWVRGRLRRWRWLPGRLWRWRLWRRRQPGVWRWRRLGWRWRQVGQRSSDPWDWLCLLCCAAHCSGRLEEAAQQSEAVKQQLQAQPAACSSHLRVCRPPASLISAHPFLTLLLLLPWSDPQGWRWLRWRRRWLRRRWRRPRVCQPWLWRWPLGDSGGEGSVCGEVSWC